MRKIVIVDGGWVWVGDYSRSEDGSIVLTNAFNIRYWGTTEGLGQLALKGPTKDTILDQVPTVIIPAARVIAEYLVSEGVKGL